MAPRGVAECSLPVHTEVHQTPARRGGAAWSFRERARGQAPPPDARPAHLSRTASRWHKARPLTRRSLGAELSSPEGVPGRRAPPLDVGSFSRRAGAARPPHKAATVLAGWGRPHPRRARSRRAPSGASRWRCATEPARGGCGEAARGRQAARCQARPRPRPARRRRRRPGPGCGGGGGGGGSGAWSRT